MKNRGTQQTMLLRATTWSAHPFNAIAWPMHQSKSILYGLAGHLMDLEWVWSEFEVDLECGGMWSVSSVECGVRCVEWEVYSLDLLSYRTVWHVVQHTCNVLHGTFSCTEYPGVPRSMVTTLLLCSSRSLATLL